MMLEGSPARAKPGLIVGKTAPIYVIWTLTGEFPSTVPCCQFASVTGSCRTDCMTWTDMTEGAT